MNIMNNNQYDFSEVYNKLRDLSDKLYNKVIIDNQIKQQKMTQEIKYYKIIPSQSYLGECVFLKYEGPKILLAVSLRQKKASISCDVSIYEKSIPLSIHHVEKSKFEQVYNQALKQIQDAFGGSNQVVEPAQVEQPQQELELVTRIKEIPNEVIRDKALAYLDNKDIRGGYSKEHLNSRFMDTNRSFKDAILWAVFLADKTEEGIQYWRNIGNNINYVPTCSFLNETPNQEPQAQEGTTLNLNAIHISEIDKLRAKLTAQIHSGNIIGINDSLDRADRIINRVLNIPFKRDEKMYL